MINVTVVALGKIGLPLAVQFAGKGHRVIGVDVNRRVVDMVQRGVEPLPGEAGLGQRLADVVRAGLLRATTNAVTATADSEVVVIVVPLVVDAAGQPDFAWIDAATRRVGSGVKPGALIVYETTLPVGTTRGRFGPMLEQESGLQLGRDLFLAFSPERVLTGRVFADLRRYPKLVGGVDEASARRAVHFYEQVLDFDARADLARANGVWDLGSAEAAEMAKLAETTYRDVNIGLANQFACFADHVGVDVQEVITAANSQPYSHIHSPGIAVGGHCIPVYPRFYLWMDPAATIVRAAREANAQMPEHAIHLLEQAYGKLGGARIVVLGAAYRGGVKETAFSGVFPVADGLKKRGADVRVHDPLYSAEELRGLGFAPHRMGDWVDAAILQADHVEYRRLRAGDLPGVRVLVDGRRITRPCDWGGVVHLTIGGGSSKA